MGRVIAIPAQQKNIVQILAILRILDMVNLDTVLSLGLCQGVHVMDVVKHHLFRVFTRSVIVRANDDFFDML